MVYEVKIFKYKLFVKSTIRGTVTITKSYWRWVCISTELCPNKKFAFREIALCLSMDKGENEYFKYTIRMVKGGAKRGKR